MSRYNATPPTAEFWIDKLGLKDHPEGGYFIEVYRSDKEFSFPKYIGARNTFSHIYYMLSGKQFSSFHRLKSDELWNFYLGSPLVITIISPDGSMEKFELGLDIENGCNLCLLVKGRTWFAASLKDTSGYCLVGCTVIPGFSYIDWEKGDRDTLCQIFPQHTQIITELTR